MPSAWTTYLATDDADATAAKIKGAGGQLLAEPMDVMEEGRMAIAMDTAGAAFGIWQGRNTTGIGVANEPGALTWNEDMSRDFEGSKAFYHDVFGYDYQDMSGDGFKYAMLMLDGHEVGGIGEYPEGRPPGCPPPGAPTSWSKTPTPRWPRPSSSAGASSARAGQARTAGTGGSPTTGTGGRHGDAGQRPAGAGVPAVPGPVQRPDRDRAAGPGGRGGGDRARRARARLQGRHHQLAHPGRVPGQPEVLADLRGRRGPGHARSTCTRTPRRGT